MKKPLRCSDVPDVTRNALRQIMESFHRLSETEKMIVSDRLAEAVLRHDPMNVCEYIIEISETLGNHHR